MRARTSTTPFSNSIFRRSSPRSRGPSGRSSARRSRKCRSPSRRRSRKHRRRIVIGGLKSGDVVIAAITSCTNTANPSVMLGAGLLARNAVARGLSVKPWVKTSLAPGSRVVGDYLAAAGLQRDLDALGFQIIGYGCTTCNGNSGPLADAIAQQITANDIAAVAVLSGNRNFAGRIHPLVPASYLASPALVVAFAIAGTVLDRSHAAAARDRNGRQAGHAGRYLAERRRDRLAAVAGFAGQLPQGLSGRRARPCELVRNFRRRRRPISVAAGQHVHHAVAARHAARIRSRLRCDRRYARTGDLRRRHHHRHPVAERCDPQRHACGAIPRRARRRAGRLRQLCRAARQSRDRGAGNVRQSAHRKRNAGRQARSLHATDAGRRRA